MTTTSFLASPEYLEHLRDASRMAGLTLPELIVPAEHQIVLGNMRFRYLDWGSPGKRPLVFLHGGGLTAHTWDLVCLALRPDYRCLALDLRGHGDSEWSPVMDYGIEAHRGDVEAFIDHLGLDGLGLVGMSLGGLTALAYAGRQAARLSSLVIIDVGPEARQEGARRIAEFVAAPAEFDSIDEVIERALSFNPRRDASLLRRSLRHNLRQMPSGKLTWKHDRRHRAKFDAEEWARRRQGLWDEVPRISCPTLVVRGGRSDVFHDEDAEKLAGALPRGSWVRVEDAGHTVQGDNPRALVTELRRFLDGRS
jgi:pimeloyl-ACP methyl ester carboxylesterase